MTVGSLDLGGRGRRAARLNSTGVSLTLHIYIVYTHTENILPPPRNHGQRAKARDSWKRGPGVEGEEDLQRSQGSEPGSTRAEQDRLRLAAMGIEGGGESPARLTPPPVRPIIRIISDVQLAPPTAGTTDVPTTPGDEDNQARFGAQPPAPTTAPARPAGDAGETATRGRDRARAPRGSTDADRGSRDRADGSLPRGSGSAPLGCAVVDRGSRDRASVSLSRDSESAPRGSAAAEREPRGHADRPPSRGEDVAPSGGAGVVHTPADTKPDGKKPPSAPSRDTKRETRKPSTLQVKNTHLEKRKISPPSPGKRAQLILETRRPTFKKTANPSLIKRTPEKKTVKSPSPQRPGAPQNSPTTPARPPAVRITGDKSNPTPQAQPKPQRPPRRLEVDVSSGAASRDSSVASMASITSMTSITSADSGPKDIKNRVQKAKSPATHPPAFGTTSGLRGKKRAQEDEPEPEFKQPTTILKYSSRTTPTPPQPSTSAATTPQGGRRGRRAKKAKAKYQQEDDAIKQLEDQKSKDKDPVLTVQSREQPNASESLRLAVETTARGQAPRTVTFAKQGEEEHPHESSCCHQRTGKPNYPITKGPVTTCIRSDLSMQASPRLVMEDGCHRPAFYRPTICAGGERRKDSY
ncbi:hypothetical protein ACJJTC_001455 [Scirpophaga incertulas]